MRRIFEIDWRILAGAAALSFFTPMAVAHTSTFKVLYSFTGEADGGEPGYGSLIMDKNGNLYGTTVLDNSYTAGTVYEVAPNGTDTVLHSFSEGSDGFGPEALIVDQKGSLWGPLCCGGNDEGCGGIFEITAQDKEKLVYTFEGSPDDGCTPAAALSTDGSGHYYGTTTGGGTYEGGTVFKLDPDGTEKPIHSFSPKHGGFYPFPALAIDASGDLCGTDVDGGPRNAGTVFEIVHGGGETMLYAFRGSPKDGAQPTGGVILDLEGNIYGTASAGGRAGCESNSGCGVAFKLEPGGAETILHFFSAKHGDGGNPVAGLIADGAGNLYGTTESGGGNCTLDQAYGCGTVFELAPGGAETILYSFSKKNGANGAFPLAGLVADSSGNLYGTASGGGTYGYGTVFEITP
jgi:uncharacterized repeat protein (TIGR03803 family)